jgi:ADP-heptose:LPS heptosyltransferase
MMAGGMRKLILRNWQSPGDLVMLTAAVRDLHRRYPGEFVTDVRTPCPDLWVNNPYLTALGEDERGVDVIDCQYPLIHESNQAPWHFLHGFIDFLNRRLSLDIRPTAFRGDIHLSEDEKQLPSVARQLALASQPYWMVAAGGKLDFTIKWWSTERYQGVVDAFRGRILFVQVGAAHHVHPALDGVVDLRGLTSLRDLIRLVYGSSGVVTPVSLLMHLAAAVEFPQGDPGARPCVVIAGGREPPHWEAYPAHQFLHTVGMLPCCASGGCWKSRTRPVGDGAEHDAPANLCVDPAGDLPRCMDMIRAEHVVERIDWYRNGAALRRRPEVPAVAAATRFLKSMPAYPGSYAGRGIVICAGGPRYFPSAWVAIHRLRAVGCRLPIELWFLGPGEMNSRAVALLDGLGVRAVDAFLVRRRHPMPRLNGWELKPYAMLHSAFEDVMLLDADNICYRDPEPLFEDAGYRSNGAIFWPDVERLGPEREAWQVFGVPYRDEPAFESGQIVLAKSKCWEPLLLAVWYNRHSEYFYRYVHGDKDTFHMAFRRLEAPYTMPARLAERRAGVFTQFDLSGAPLFQHGIKWNLDRDSTEFAKFPFFGECRQYLDDLRERWDGRLSNPPAISVLRPAWSLGARDYPDPVGTEQTGRLTGGTNAG